MKKYKNRAILLSSLLIFFYIAMWSILSEASHSAFLAVGGAYIYPMKTVLLNTAGYVLIGLMIAFLPFELLYGKIRSIYSDLYEGKESNKKLLATVILVAINIIIGVIFCYFRSRIEYFFYSTGIRFKYVVLAILCLCVWINVYAQEINKKGVQFALRSFVNVYNSFFVYFILKDLAIAIIVFTAMTVLTIIYDTIYSRSISWKNTISTIGVYVTVLIAGVLITGYYKADRITELQEKLYNSFSLVSTELGAGFLILFVLAIVATEAVLVYGIKILKKKSLRRCGMLIAVAMLFVTSVIYILLSNFGIVPCCDMEFIQSRIHIVILLLAIRCLIVFPVPVEKQASLMERLNSVDYDDDLEIDWIENKIERLMKKQNLISQYIATLDLKLEEISCELNKEQENYEERKKELESIRQNLKELGCPQDIEEFTEKLKALYEKK